MTNKVTLLKKKIRGRNFGPTDLYQTQNEVFRHFLKFGSLVFLEIKYNDSFQQCLTPCVEVKSIRKIFAAQIWAKQAKIRPKIKVFRHFLKFGSLVLLEIAYNDSLQQYLTSSGGRTHEKNLGQNRALN